MNADAGGPHLVPGYRDLKRVGYGGSSVVYHAEQIDPARAVALKIMTVPVDQRSLARFHEECGFAAQLGEHPHIVTMLNHGLATDGQPYLAMPYFPDGSLADRLDRDGPLPVADVLRYGIQIAGALAFVHELGLVHRDVKPGNILVSRHGPVLADFGVAVLGDSLSTDSRTQAFTPGYTAPEVLESPAAAGPASDVYALGGTLYHLLTGHPPFSPRADEGISRFVRRIATESPEPINRPDVSPELAAVLATAMGRYPAARFGTAVALAQALQHVQRSQRLDVTELPYAADRPLRTVEPPPPVEPPVEAPVEAPPLQATVVRIDRQPESGQPGQTAKPEPPPPVEGAAGSLRRHRTAAVVVMLGAMLLLPSLFLTYTTETALDLTFSLSSRPYVVIYTVLMVGLLLGGGIALLRPTARTAAGGFLLGVGAAASWPLAVDTVDWLGVPDERAGPGLLINLAGHALIVAGAVLALSTVRGVGSGPPGTPGWLTVLMGLIGAGALAVLAQQRAELILVGWGRLADDWIAAVAAAVAITAAVVRPRWFAAALLAGWVGGGAALFLRYQLNDDTPPFSPLVFGATLLLLGVVTVRFAGNRRTPPGARS
jgi:serine/threonine protein kinase